MKNTIINPNFSIVAPGGCNAKCDFCYWKADKTSKTYKDDLINILDSMPSQFTQLSITGGEPTMSPYLSDILNVIDRKKWEKTILTTNGFNIKTYIPLMQGKIDHVNISRHHWDDKLNQEVFKTDTVPNSEELREIINSLKEVGITTTFSAVLGDYINTYKDVLVYIACAKSLGVEQVFFRTKHGTLEPSDVEKFFYFVDSETHTCPVCRDKKQVLHGVNVIWKASLLEPSQELGEIYELIYNQNGILTADWAQKIKILPSEIIDNNIAVKMVREIKKKRIKIKKSTTKTPKSNTSGCGHISGCGH